LKVAIYPVSFTKLLIRDTLRLHPKRKREPARLIIQFPLTIRLIHLAIRLMESVGEGFEVVPPQPGFQTNAA
jgi:hypothetical protein